MARDAVDERGFEVVRRIRKANADISLSAFKATVREQFYMLLIDQDAALAAIPEMLPHDPDVRWKAFGLITEVMDARGEYSFEDRERMRRVARLFGVTDPTGKTKSPSIVFDNDAGQPAKAS